MSESLTHFNEQQRARMVDITEKKVTERTAVVQSRIVMKPETLLRIKEGRIGKGDVLAVAQVAGIMAAKKTSDMIPMCHPLALTGVDIAFSDNAEDTLYIEVTVKTKGLTGVEMEALTAATVTGLTVYDMCKAMDKEMVVGPTYLAAKTGGKSGDFANDIKIHLALE
ncbi:cyclic pyranopterin monophosphate synthase MoaC [Aneurinibacillus aneurinilyticus]|jgi:cyclic pyranopterin phosphate synthase|uniref:Cyclic pyranopterin monophosphate synthase n=2 Tax=Aneurinibacillus aneurinilyticus TaxID=1391 RepID=A0A848CRN8_ANEAE|nr:cyclic pyranopterin monophosphate synthase MoaC [Aneurinibacillus aneurinilyticus]ERI08204.1 molybdenum cofactor biosynthesis protein [Aneurinibacillus aneurinilyticus ATCC 12856]MCI1696849.1 cyclic pyranopterin monophosphate synthase MoaC [Aneurinibacillus aneurinilyticus]MED0670503.1 cyclic pyranopterin monophosphate synthase MoaC [Aneurinibacillus aneurinilyticus]MED0704634.1 cyclic pyranopterin monophosphate synthase MoaC [Aneurinibacillus aneurinilyticus]MED0721566.1 cyclic pyranopteri